MNKTILWSVFFLICFVVGLFHGSRPTGVSSTELLFPPKTIQVLVTDEILFPEGIRHELEQKLSVRFNVTVTRDWNSYLVKLVESSSADLIITPSFWSNTLQKQNLLADIEDLSPELIKEVSPDFLKGTSKAVRFFPLYWMKTIFIFPEKVSFTDFVKNKNLPTLYLLADEDLVLAHLKKWEQQGILESILQKKILVHPLEQTHANMMTDGAQESALHLMPETPTDDVPYTSALMVWGASIPQNSANKKTALKVLKYIASVEFQNKWIEESPFSSCLSSLADKKIPLNRKAEWVRDLKLNETILIEDKDGDAVKKLRETYKLNVL